jgi:hypothetical protein
MAEGQEPGVGIAMVSEREKEIVGRASEALSPEAVYM